MTGAEILLDRFDALIDSPDAVEKLRRFALRLCVTGRLTKSLPELWPEVTLGDLVDVTGGGTPSKRNAEFWEGGAIPWVSPKDMKVWEIEDSQDHVTEAAVEGSAAKRIKPGDVLIVVRGMILAHTAPAALLRVPATINQDMKALRPADGVEPDFLLRLLWGLNGDILDRVETSSHGTKRLPTDALLGLPFRLPPVEEQHQIVARVDELMALCDRLSDGLAHRDELRQRWAASTVRHVTDDAPIGGAPAWPFAEAHLDTLLAAPEAVPLVRRMVLDLAVRGDLTARTTSGMAEVSLVQRVAALKEALYEAGEIRKPKRPKAVRPSEQWFPAPQGWAWARLIDVSLKITDGAHKTPTYVEAGMPFVSVKDFSDGILDLGNTRLIPPDEHKRIRERSNPRRGDLLIARIGTIGKPVVVDTDIEFSLFVSAGMIRPAPDEVDPDFLRLVLSSGYAYRAYDEIKVGGSTHTNKLNLRDLRSLPVPMPPLEEQQAIVSKISSMSLLVDELQDQINRSRNVAENLRNTLLDGIRSASATLTA